VSPDRLWKQGIGGTKIQERLIAPISNPMMPPMSSVATSLDCIPEIMVCIIPLIPENLVGKVMADNLKRECLRSWQIPE
jgi:hypothetical protein